MNYLNDFRIKKQIKTDLQNKLLLLKISVTKNFWNKVIVIKNKPQLNGDFCSNLIFLLKKTNLIKLEEIDPFINELQKIKYFENVFLSKNDFLNFKINNHYFQYIVKTLNDKSDIYQWFNWDVDNSKKVNLEFLSANPTGNLHAGHLRNAMIGHFLTAIYKFFKYPLVTTHYTNDYGRQIQLMAVSLLIAYLKQNDVQIFINTDGLYKDKLYFDAALKIKTQYQDQFIHAKYNEDKILDEATNKFFVKFGTEFFIDYFKKLMSSVNIYLDEWYYESSMHNKRNDLKLLDDLNHKNLTYKKDNALFLKSTLFGDDKDRVLVKADQNYTYMVSDLYYHIQRAQKYDILINVWGSDHAGYIKRICETLKNLVSKSFTIDIVVTQLVSIMVEDKKQKLSKRKNHIVNLEQLLDALNEGCLRFYMLNKSVNRAITIDVAELKTNWKNSDYYYCQYALVRLKSILRKYAAWEAVEIKSNDFIYLDIEQRLIFKILEAYEMLISTINLLDSYLYLKYISELAKLVHQYLNQQQILEKDHLLETQKRIMLIKVVKNLLEQLLLIIDIKPLNQL